MALHLIDYNAIFIHIPKTGGTFVRHVINDVLKLRTEEVGYKHSHPDLIGSIAADDDKYLFAFVRDPLDWYRSYWAMKKWHVEHKSFGDLYEKDLLWHPTWKIDRNCYSSNFQEFVRKVEKVYPGFIFNMYRQYTSNIDFIGHQEKLVDQLILVLNQLGIACNLGSDTLKKVNDSNLFKDEAVYSYELRVIVQENNPMDILWAPKIKDWNEN